MLKIVKQVEKIRSVGTEHSPDPEALWPRSPRFPLPCTLPLPLQLWLRPGAPAGRLVRNQHLFRPTELWKLLISEWAATINLAP